MHQLFKEITPPIIVNLYKQITRKYGWVGNFATWEEALRNSKSYDSAIIFEKVTNALLKVKNGEAEFERDSVVFDKIEYSWPLLAGIMWVAAQSRGQLSVLDFGGSLGSTYFQNRKFLRGLTNVQWGVVEQPQFVETGVNTFGSSELKFYTSVEECFEKLSPQVVIFSCVLQYLAKPFEVIEKVMQHKPKTVIVDNMPFLTTGKSRITVQKVDPRIYDASYPCWFLNKTEFLEAFRNYDMIEDFVSPLSIQLDNNTIPYEGFIFKARH